MHGFGFLECQEVLNHWNQNLQRFFHRPNASGHEEDFEIAMNLKEVAILKKGVDGSSAQPGFGGFYGSRASNPAAAARNDWIGSSLMAVI
jgi:hypothetical protein